MKKILTIVFIVIAVQSFGQADSVSHPKTDSSKPPKKAINADTVRQTTTTVLKTNDTTRAKNNPVDSLHKDSLKIDSNHIKTKVTPVKKEERFGYDGQPRVASGKEQLFYILAGLSLFMGLVKVSYPKYFQNIFRQFFQTSLRQKQTPEQIVQGYVPGFLLNLLFFMVGGMLIALYGTKQGFLHGPLWLSILFCTGILACIYVLKYVVTFFAGWVFNVKEAAVTYSFIVFLVNRVIGIILLPILILLAFYGTGMEAVMFTVAGSIVILLLTYRYALSLTVIGKNLKVSALHFFIYLCAVELMPLLVIYKVLFSIIAGNK